MTERIKQAIEKARLARNAQLAVPGTAPETAPKRTHSVTAIWDRLPTAELDRRRLERNRIVSVDVSHPAYGVFAVLRTRILKLCRENGWSQIAITSPTKGCGKSLVGLNLAFSLARNSEFRTMLLECDMRAPSLTKTLGIEPARGVHEFLAGDATASEAFVRLNPTLAVCANSGFVPNSSELLMSQRAVASLRAARDEFAPGFVLYDLPPLLNADDALAFLPNVDVVLLVAASGETTAEDITECEHLLDTGPSLLGVVFNKANSRDVESYSTDY